MAKKEARLPLETEIRSMLSSANWDRHSLSFAMRSRVPKFKSPQNWNWSPISIPFNRS